MKIDLFGVAHRTANEICDLLYLDPELNLCKVDVDDPEDFNRSLKELYYDSQPLTKYRPTLEDIASFDARQQNNWYMPQSYKEMDISKWLLEQCQTDEELQRVGKELLMYQDRDLLVLLKFMKYFVDTMREHNVVWGVGRGSSVSSYCLFLIGVHKIDSIYFDLDISEFLKD